VFHHPHGEESALFQFTGFPPCPITTPPCEKPLSILPVAPSGTGTKVTPEPSLLQAEQPQLSQPFLTGEVLQPSDHLRGPPLDPLQHIHVFLMLGAGCVGAGPEEGHS